MPRVIILASRMPRTAFHAGMLRTMIVSGCALALVLARMPLGF
ncbi:hypothetical protein HNO88_001201 [Novosphingobium chloroacetimidivorans]|uniref:Uncharacterized protein n=1 Tax=Novosphingobium chloroacetimidivorans TaxID=1428314 RepID=A0A7W7NWA0_9SPHN|nr:hypothetical protein [Novosphingobium chloroacetimidivorans]MBB4857887.1 hypothetical protein [Novosphingobium chloroacetimidivorans]